MPSRLSNRSGPNPVSGSRTRGSALDLSQLQGVVMRLPSQDGLPTHSKLPEGCYQHPVVILSPRASSPTALIEVLIVTSFNGTDIHTKIPRNATRRRGYLPIDPAQHPDTDIQLRLENGAFLKKKSYVNTQEQHTVPVHILQPYDRRDTGTRYVLSSDSYKALASHAGYAPPTNSPYNNPPLGLHSTPYPPTTRTAAERLQLAPVYVTYGTMPTSEPRQAASSPRGYGSRPRPLHEPSLNTVQAAHHQCPPTRPRQPDNTGILPRYYPPYPSAHHFGNGNGSNPSSSAKKRVLYAVLLGVTVWGLWSAWAHRAEIGNGLLGGVIWIGRRVLRWMRAAVGGLCRALVGLVRRLLGRE